MGLDPVLYSMQRDDFMKSNSKYIYEKAEAAKEASYKLASIKSEIKDAALSKMADELERNSDRILEANARDIKNATSTKLHPSFMLLYE